MGSTAVLFLACLGDSPTFSWVTGCLRRSFVFSGLRLLPCCSPCFLAFHLQTVNTCNKGYAPFHTYFVAFSLAIALL